MSEQVEGHVTTEQELEARAIYEDLDGNRVKLNPEVPFNHKWFTGEFHKASWGSDISPFGGRSIDRVRVSMIGRKMEPDVHSGIASAYGIVTAVIEEADRGIIGESGWWKIENLSHSTKTATTKRHSITRRAA